MSEITTIGLGQAMRERGVKHALYTDVSRDGLLRGVNAKNTIELANRTGLSVIASGGIASLSEVSRLSRSGAVAGVIIGMALYTGRISLADAMKHQTEPAD